MYDDKIEDVEADDELFEDALGEVVDEKIEAPLLEIFPVQDLPRELRCMIWEYVVLQDNVFELDDHPALQKFGSEKPSRAIRRHIPGYFRPTAILTRHEELLRRKIQQVYMINRTPALFLVSMETYVEAREVAFRHVVLEIDNIICRPVLNKWLANIQNPMLRNMRNLYLCTHAKIPRPQTFVAPMAFGSSWPMLDFDHRQVPLFHISVSTDGGTLMLRSQRKLVASDEYRLNAALATWREKLSSDHRFSSIDLVHLATIVQNVQISILNQSWTLLLNDQDRALHQFTTEAQNTHERKTGQREFADAWMTLEPDFRVTIGRWKAPCMEMGRAMEIE